jgi:hypothetical protein
MLDFRQNNEISYQGGAVMQKTGDDQLRGVDQRHGELRELEVKKTIDIHQDNEFLFISRRISFNCMRFIETLLNLSKAIMKSSVNLRH